MYKFDNKKYFNIEFLETDQVIVLDQYEKEIFRITGNCDGDMYNNILITDEMCFLNYDKTKCKVNFHNERTYSDEQLIRNNEFQNKKISDVEIFYKMRGNTLNPTKMIFSFPSFSTGFAKIKYGHSNFKGLTEDRLEDTCIVILQDNYSVFGTYFMHDDNGNDVKTALIKFMRLKMEEYRIDESSTLFVGASKGGTLAKIFGSYFPRGKIISICGHSNIFLLASDFPNLNNIFKYYMNRNGLENFYLENISEVDKIYNNNQEIVAFMGIKDVGTNDRYVNSALANQRVYCKDCGHDILSKAINEIYNELYAFVDAPQEVEFAIEDFEYNIEKNNLWYRIGFQDILIHDRATFSIEFINKNDIIEKIIETFPIRKSNGDGAHVLFAVASKGNKFEKLLPFFNDSEYKIRLLITDVKTNTKFISNQLKIEFKKNEHKNLIDELNVLDFVVSDNKIKIMSRFNCITNDALSVKLIIKSKSNVLEYGLKTTGNSNIKYIYPLDLTPIVLEYILDPVDTKFYLQFKAGFNIMECEIKPN